MTAVDDYYLRQVLARHRVDTGPTSPALAMRTAFIPVLQRWAGGQLLSVQPSGSFAKGTAVRSGTDIDLFISLAHDTTQTLQEIHESLIKTLQEQKLSPRRQTVSIGVRATHNGSAFDVDLVPAKKRDDYTGDHSLYHRKSGTARKTNIARHVSEVLGSGRLEEIKILKIWRNQRALEFPSFYLELATIAALAGKPIGDLANNVSLALHYLHDTFPNARIPDPAVPSNFVSDDLTAAERQLVRSAAGVAVQKTWAEFVV